MCVVNVSADEVRNPNPKSHNDDQNGQEGRTSLGGSCLWTVQFHPKRTLSMQEHYCAVWYQTAWRNWQRNVGGNIVVKMPDLTGMGVN